MQSQEIAFFTVVLCSFISAIVLLVYLNRNKQSRATVGTIISLLAVSTALMGFTIFSVKAGFCGNQSWVEVLSSKSLGMGICTLNIPVSYGIVASAITLALWNGIASLYRSTRKLGNNSND
jgi:chromate transport protein ChrA